IINIILNACVVAVIWIGGRTVEEGLPLRPGAIMAAITYLSMLLMGLMSMIMVFQTFTRALASAKRIREVLDEPELIRDGGFAGDTGGRTGEIELKNVSFSYPSSGGKKVLEGVDLKVNKGETVAILGSTGSGKSTLIDLIPRFYDATEGEVLVDGVNVRDYDLGALRAKIAMVPQKAELYCRPIEANIRWGKDGADPWEIKRAAEIAQADDFICATPEGYYTQVTEGGHSLSGGQKQRIALSRAVLKDAEIMIFDDSTSALDLSTEAKLYRALEETRPDTTKIIIAQRIASVRGADRIAVLDNGRIAACGTHEELMQSSPVYRDICFSQLKEDEQ
ncbi:MAG: ABC transporter ATP-binding protein, partial [Clostridia bacterium]|nr:ABC transporter ATP-binding protein [Clostridia bacterium]